MTVLWTIAEVTLRGLLGRRRTVLLVLLAAVPVLVALLARLGGAFMSEALVTVLELGVRSVLPLIALVFATSALGAELEDGTATFILAKPVPRWQIVLAKVAVAGLLAAALGVFSVLLTGLVIGGLDTRALATTFAFAIAVAVASFAYSALFVALSVVTGRALIVGLVYTLVWEGVLAGLLEGTRVFSIREATIAIAEALAPLTAGIDGDVSTAGAVGLLVIAGALAFAVATARLSAYEVRGIE